MDVSVLSLSLLNAKGEIIPVKGLEKNNRIKVYYRKYYLNSTDDTCYGFNYTKNKSPSTSGVDTDTSDSPYMICYASEFEDILLGHKGGLSWWMITLIVIGSIAIAGGIGFAVWKFACGKGNTIGYNKI